MGGRSQDVWEPGLTMRYRLSSPRRGLHKGRDIHLYWRLEGSLSHFSGFVLVADQHRVPSSPEDGVEIFRWKPEAEQVEGFYEAWVSLTPLRQHRWARFFCKATVLDPAQRHTTLIIHPNVCIPISETGKLEVTKVGRVQRRYRRGAPRTIMCPSCFEEFPVGRMLFTAYRGGERVTALYSWLDRLLRRPPRPPRNEYGECLCPCCQQSLPFIIGTQETLIIGFVGAVYRGQRTYIASLIKQLGDKITRDRQGYLAPVTYKTEQHYRHECYDPLFGKHSWVAKTVSMSPPLIYDLTLNGHLCGERRHRAVTLSLHYTAGEAFSTVDMVRHTVPYLRCASGIIFLIDPLQLPAVREMLPPHDWCPVYEHDPEVRLSRVLQALELENWRIQGRSAPLPIPIAVVFTKCDVLRDAGLIERDRLWNTGTRHIRYFNPEIHNDMSGMMGEYLQHWSPAAYNLIVQRFSRHAFFGVSATGCTPVSGRYEHISPWRVEEPLLWLLAELGVIPTR